MSHLSLSLMNTLSKTDSRFCCFNLSDAVFPNDSPIRLIISSTVAANRTSGSLFENLIDAPKHGHLSIFLREHR